MITKIRIENFRCIRELEMGLEPLTVLVGPNASGKSTVLAALSSAIPIPGAMVWHDDAGRVFYAGKPPSQQLGPIAARHPQALLCQFDLKAMRRPNSVQQETELLGDGANLANAFATLPRRKQAKLAEELVRLVDTFGDVDVRPLHAGSHRIVFQDRWDETRWFEPHEVSDGTMLVLAFLVLQHQEQRLDIICLEEPERGLHPYLLGQIIDLLRDISQGKHGPPTQFVLATQSAELLDHVQPNEVRFLERDAEGGVQVRTAPTEDEAWADAIREYENSVGQMWLSGSLGGVPGTA